MNNDFKKQVRGITLVALVVTIIVLLILAGIAINLTVGNNGLFSRAGNAADTWKMAEQNEKREMQNFEGLYDNTLKDLDLDGSGNSGTGGDDDTTKSVNDITGDETENTEVVDENGDKAVIPAGFTVDPENNTVQDGLVIIDKNAENEDTVGNQFVWIPCEIETEENKEDGKLKYDRYAFTRSGWSYGQNKLNSKDADGSYKIQRVDKTGFYYHEAMPEEERVSVETYGGFYIGRYETGKLSDIAKIQPSISVYNYVTISQAETISKGMYIGKSRLCSSYAWDTALKFIDGETGTYAVNSTGGNYTSTLRSTGYHKVKNIYDMGGNALEVTTETHSYASINGCYRRTEHLIITLLQMDLQDIVRAGLKAVL